MIVKDTQQHEPKRGSYGTHYLGGIQGSQTDSNKMDSHHLYLDNRGIKRGIWLPVAVKIFHAKCDKPASNQGLI